jgi:hypothetical protein
MKASNVLKLNKWAQSHRQWISSEQPTQSQMVTRAGNDLGFKVSVSSLRDVLLANDIQTRRIPKHVAEIAGLKEEVERLRAILVKVITASTVPEWLRKELETEDLTNEAKAALQKGRVPVEAAA